MVEEDKKQDRYLLLSHSITYGLYGDGRNIGVITATVHYLDDKSGKPRNFGPSVYDAKVQGDYLCGLELRGQYNSEDGYEKTYGFSVEYRGLSTLDLQVARFLAKTLGKMERKIETYRKKWGDAPDFATSVTRAANALSVKGILVRTGGKGSTFDNCTYAEWAPGEARYAIDSLIHHATKKAY